MISWHREQVSSEESMRKIHLAAVIAACVTAAPMMAQSRGRGNGGVPPGQRPPAGMCRIWIDGVPPGHQPAPTDCATAAARVPANARIIYGDQTSAYPRDPRRDVYDQSGRVYDPRRADQTGRVVYDPRRVDPSGQVVYDPRRVDPNGQVVYDPRRTDRNGQVITDSRRVDQNGRVISRSERDDRVAESKHESKNKSKKHKGHGNDDDRD